VRVHLTAISRLAAHVDRVDLGRFDRHEDAALAGPIDRAQVGPVLRTYLAANA
jgi:hypothetical protein